MPGDGGPPEPTAAELDGFLRRSAIDRAELVAAVPGGVAVRSPRYDHAHDHNTLVLWRRAGPAAVLAAADDVLAGLEHRRVEVGGAAIRPELAAALAAAGYEREDHLLMTATRPPAGDRPPPTGVVELELPERIAVARAEWARDRPEFGELVHHQLADRIRTATAAARCTFLAVRGPLGEVVAHADLFERDRLAQVEEVMTDEAHRGRGHASRLVLAARARAGAATVFLVADADDWPCRLYDRLGFDVTGRRQVWTRLSAP